MRQLIISAACLLLAINGHSQNVGIGTNTPNANAILDIQHDSKGILIPRMDSVQRKQIPNTKGLMVYDTTYNSFWYNTGTAWQRMIAGNTNSAAVPAGDRVGDMLYWNGAAWTLVPVGLPGQALVLNNAGVPRWGAAATDTSTNGNAYFFPTTNNSAYKNFLGLLYARLACTGLNNGGGPFITDVPTDIDFTRSLWMLQELPTDEAIAAWNDAGVQELNQCNFLPSNPNIKYAYLRLKDIIVNANSFLKATTSERLAETSVPVAEQNRIITYRAEARYLRALAYYYAIDLFGGFEMMTENDPATSFNPPFIDRFGLFNFVETELLAIDTDLPAAKTNEYGRADKACAWMVLAKLYINAEVYIGTAKYTNCLTYLNMIINTAQYSLTSEYKRLFLTDNNVNGATEEIIFPVIADGKKLPTYGGATFLTHAAIGGNLQPADFGVDYGWSGLRTRREFAYIMDATGTADSRNFLYKTGQSQNITNPSNFTEGYGIIKYKNKTFSGANGTDITYVGTDYPLFRLPDVWLMYAESVLRGGSGGNVNMAVMFMNFIRGRSGAAGISSSDLTLNYVFDERSRELYWEGHRRSDLIRFSRFSGLGYVWQWKGGIINGTSTYPFTNLYPIPASVLAGNSNIFQNPGY